MWYAWTLKRHLIWYLTMAFSISSIQLESQAIYGGSCKNIYSTDSSVSELVTLYHTFALCSLEFLKEVYWDHSCLLFLLMIFLNTSTLPYSLHLQMTLNVYCQSGLQMMWANSKVMLKVQLCGAFHQIYFLMKPSLSMFACGLNCLLILILQLIQLMENLLNNSVNTRTWVLSFPVTSTGHDNHHQSISDPRLDKMNI